MAASFSQPPFLSSFPPIKKYNLTLSPQHQSFAPIKTSRIQSSQDQNPAESQPLEKDPVKLALAKAKAYKKSVKSGAPSPEIAQTPPQGPQISDDFRKIEAVGSNIDGKKGVDEGGGKDIPSSVKLALEKAKEYKKNAGVDNGGVGGSEILASGTVYVQLLVFFFFFKLKLLLGFFSCLSS